MPVGAEPSCTSTGTNRNDKIRGDENRDVICLLNGSDYGHGRGGSDVVRGNPGGDTLVGGNGADTIVGGDGEDDLFAVDDAGGDVINGGPNRDNCYGDFGDTMIDCEHKVRV